MALPSCDIITSYMGEAATYAYCVVHRSGRPSVTRMPPGLPGASVPRIVEVDGRRQWLVCADVPLSLYGARVIEQKLHDLEWVSQVAVAHEAVVERFGRARNATVIPMKLFTIFASEERAVAEMRRKRKGIDAIAARIRGCEEWGVRITRLTRPRPEALSQARGLSGAEFLARKKRTRDAAREQTLEASEAAGDAYRALGKVAKAVAVRPPPDGAATPPLLDAAFLVPLARKTRFRRVAAQSAQRCSAAGAELIVSGPWPAYNFLHEGDDTA